MTDTPRTKPERSDAVSDGAASPPSPTGLLSAFLGAILRPPAASRGRFILAMCVALAADLLFWWLGEALPIMRGMLDGTELPVVTDFAVAFVLALCLGGFSVELLAACIAEATPGVGLLPAWSVAVPILWARANAARSATEAATSPRSQTK